MALSIQQINDIGRLLLELDPATNPLPQVRAGFPGIAVSRCEPDDMRGVTPYQRSAAYDLFLIDTSKHCWCIVDEPQQAGGVVIAAHA